MISTTLIPKMDSMENANKILKGQLANLLYSNKKKVYKQGISCLM